MSELDRRVIDILGLVLDRVVDPEQLPTRETDDAWDSLKHVELLFTLEDEFGVRFDETELRELTDVPSIARAVERHREA